jgi:hypothetical protein
VVRTPWLPPVNQSGSATGTSNPKARTYPPVPGGGASTVVLDAIPSGVNSRVRRYSANGCPAA